MSESEKSSRSFVETAGHLALWPALYAGAALVCFARLSTIWQTTRAFAFAIVSVVFTALGTYLIDRVKLADRFLDPADLSAQPARYKFLRAHTQSARVLAFSSLLIGGICGFAVSRWAPVATLCCAIGVSIYAFKPRSNWPRPKDVIWIKNLYVALGIATFTALAALAAASPIDSPRAWLEIAQFHLEAVLATFAFVTVRVLIDAALCDIDDETTDRQFGTSTAATKLGGQRVRQLTNVIHLSLCVILLLIPFIPLHARIRWATAGVIGIVTMSLIRPNSLRDFIDLRYPIEAVACIVISFFW